MTLERFLQLDYAGRMAATGEATCIAGRDLTEFKVLLYQHDNFYIEVYYHRKLNFISRFYAFDSLDHLEPYLEKIKVLV